MNLNDTGYISILGILDLYGIDDIRAFKNSKKTKQEFKCLFKADDDNNLPYVEAIKKKAWRKKNITKKDTAFTLAICEIVLNPKHLKISVSDNALHNRFNIYWSCICNSEEITSSTTKSIRQEELEENYLNTSEESDGNESSGDNLNNNEDSDNSNEDNDDMKMKTKKGVVKLIISTIKIININELITIL
ncbi:unnamed protein product [Rhizophagus irregularis]|nr:unnamed protein product [Rhizophagus irregularis]